jgi:PAS domain S-box-containing protein
MESNEEQLQNAAIRNLADALDQTSDLSRQKEFYQNILENIPTDIVIFDPDHKYIYVNPYAIRNEEFRKYIIGKDDFEYLRYRNRDTTLAEIRREKFLEVKETGKVVEWEDCTTSPQGEVMTSLRKFYPVYDHSGQLTLVIGFGIDITEQKKAQEYVKNINQELEQKIQERTNDLSSANEDLNTFNSMVSHDLQAPLRSLSGVSHILADKYADKLDEDGKELLKIIDRNAKQMSSLIRGLLKFSQLGKAPLTLSDVNMNELVATVLSEIKSDQIDPKTKIIVHELPSCSCDEILMKQVWYNLIGNAIKYSSKKEAPVIEIGSTKNEHGQFCYVRDNGAGFDTKYTDRLFTIFQRLHTQSEFEGTGVGLALVHRIVTKHGGRIWAESVKDEGATFYFTLH